MAFEATFALFYRTSLGGSLIMSSIRIYGPQCCIFSVEIMVTNLNMMKNMFMVEILKDKQKRSLLNAVHAHMRLIYLFRENIKFNYFFSNSIIYTTTQKFDVTTKKTYWIQSDMQDNLHAMKDNLQAMKR